jgi:uncharacterized protein (DUF1697 family)
MLTNIALFRGINVGGKNKLPMKQLISLMNECGFEDCQYYIQTGNVIFNSKSSPTEAVAERVYEECGFRPEVMFLTIKDLEVSHANNPYPSADGKQCHFYFCKEPPSSADLKKIDQLKSENEQYQLIDQVFYLYAPDGVGRSKLAAKVEKCLGVATTARNLNTVQKLIDLSKEY